MDEWGKIAVIVAIVTIPIYASPLVLAPLFNRVYQFLCRVFYRNARCEAIRWQDLHRLAIKPFALLQPASSSTSERGFLGSPRAPAVNSSSIMNFINFFEDMWQAKPTRVDRPSYLEANKDYLRIDADVLMTAIFLIGRVFGSDTQRAYFGVGSSFAFRYGTVSGRFRRYEIENDSYIVGQISGFPPHETVPLRFRGIRKDDLRAIANGYPPFYRQTFTAHSGVEIDHPVRTMRDIHRAGWVAAIGFSSDLPVHVYNARYKSAYHEACDRVRQMLKRLQSEYSANAVYSPLLEVAVRAVRMMNQNSSGSGLPSIVHGTVFRHCDDGRDIGTNLNAAQLRFALKLFNDYSEASLSADERDRLEPILEEVLKAAVNGIYTWWQYLNNDSSPLPGWLLDERIRQTPIWVENGDSIEVE